MGLALGTPTVRSDGAGDVSLDGTPETGNIVGLALREMIASPDGAMLGSCKDVAGEKLICWAGMNIGVCETSLLGLPSNPSVGAVVG